MVASGTLSQESLGTNDGCEFRLENLEGDIAIVALIVGEIDRGHPALPDLALDAVAALKGGVQAGDGIGHQQSPKREDQARVNIQARAEGASKRPADDRENRSLHFF